MINDERMIVASGTSLNASVGGIPRAYVPKACDPALPLDGLPLAAMGPVEGAILPTL